MKTLNYKTSIDNRIKIQLPLENSSLTYLFPAQLSVFDSEKGQMRLGLARLGQAQLNLTPIRYRQINSGLNLQNL